MESDHRRRNRYGTFNNHFDDGALDGNKSTVTSLAVFLGAASASHSGRIGASRRPSAYIYAHTENDFDARNEAGQNVLRLAGGQVNDLVNWSADTITVVPGMEARYRHLFGSVQLTVKSLFKYFNTQPIERSTTALSFESDSKWWLNEVDVEWRMPLYLWGRQLRTRARTSAAPSSPAEWRRPSRPSICTRPAAAS